MRRALLEGMADLDLDAARVILDSPVAVADAKWFASAADLGRSLRNRVRINDSGPPVLPVGRCPSPTAEDQRNNVSFLCNSPRDVFNT